MSDEVTTEDIKQAVAALEEDEAAASKKPHHEFTRHERRMYFRGMAEARDIASGMVSDSRGCACGARDLERFCDRIEKVLAENNT